MPAQSNLEWKNPLVLATVTALSLGGALIAHKYAGTVAAGVVGIPALLSSLVILRYTASATVAVSRVAVRDVRNWTSTIRGKMAAVLRPSGGGRR